MQASEENFRILRVTAESHSALPAVFAVSSALPIDGASFVACGLARAFAEAGHSTLLLEANAQPTVASELGIDSLGQRNAIAGIGTRVPGVENLSVASLGHSDDAYKGNLAALVASARAAYRVVVLATAPIPESGTALELAREANGVVLAVKLGRRPHAADQMVQRLLGENRTRLLGVVPTRGDHRVRPSNAVTIPTIIDIPVRALRGPIGVEVVS
ncbi:MAG: hypothetical protein NVS3B16_15120 [Vulcanimicrobiaceae bacterium]